MVPIRRFDLLRRIPARRGVYATNLSISKLSTRSHVQFIQTIHATSLFLQVSCLSAFEQSPGDLGQGRHLISAAPRDTDLRRILICTSKIQSELEMRGRDRLRQRQAEEIQETTISADYRGSVYPERRSGILSCPFVSFISLLYKRRARSSSRGRNSAISMFQLFAFPCAYIIELYCTAGRYLASSQGK
ncbi:hypothetical protein BV22DRAFT_13181 [Leucogyrophana mollusca]|uniref:Uncharacterized protein n=1 Tax=Leucogyrophana mollusca TaxID=85980 RepID=A0ACB8C1S0_9AGAM|nr:hypothetical protein BV22DRAFT_13181 [Leucogyrophana mollusca]